MTYLRIIFGLILTFIFVLTPFSAIEATTVPVGVNPRTSIAANEKVYALNQGNATVSVINTDTNTVISTLNVGSNPIYAVFLNDKLYVKNNSSGTVSVINTLTDTVSSTITLGGALWGIATVGNKVYVSRVASDTVSVINTETDTVEASIAVGDAPRNFFVLGNKVYVHNSNSNNVSVMDSLSNTVIATIPSVPSSGNSTLYGLGNKLYVSDTDSGVVTVINTVSDSVLSTINTGGEPGEYSFAFGKYIYVGDPGSLLLYVIDTETDTFQTVNVSGSYYSYVLNGRAYTNNYAVMSITVVDLNSNDVSDTISVGVGPAGLTSIDERYVYFGNYFDNNVEIIDSLSIGSARPELLSFSTTSGGGTYNNGETIVINANFGRNLLAGSTMNIMLNNGASVVLDQVSGSTLSGDYVITGRSDTPDLAVSSIDSASVTDSTNTYTRTSYDLPSSVGSFTGENSLITRNIGDNKNIEIGEFVKIDVGDNPYQISGNISGHIYVANQGSDDVSVVRLSDKTVVDTIDVGEEPYGLASATIGSDVYLYVANINSDDVSVINTTTNTVVDTVDVGVKPYYVAVVGTDVYVTNGASNTVSVIDANTNTVTDTIPVGSYPRGIKAYGTDLYVANYGDPNYSGGNYISVIDSSTQTVTDTIIMPAGFDGPRGVNVLGDKVYVTGYRSDNVAVIDTSDNSVEEVIDVGAGPRGLAGTGTTLYVENFDEGTVSVINTNTNTVTTEVEVGHSPSGITIVGTDAYISSFQDGLVRVLDTTTNSMKVIVPDPEPTATYGSYIKKPEAKLETGPVLPFIPPVSETKEDGVCEQIPGFMLKLGSRGEAVKVLQLRLNENLFDSGIADGIFGPMTDKAVKAFQKAKSLGVDGIVGPITRAELDKACKY